MNYRKNGVDRNLMLKMKGYGKQLTADIANNITNQQLTLDEFIKGIKECDIKSLPNTKIVWNLSAFVNIISIDLKIITRDLALAEDDWSQRHYIRQAYLLIYEFYKTYYAEQKDYYILINEKLDITELNAEKHEIIISLREYKKQYEKIFYAIRNTTIAHRNQDVLLQVEMIENLNYSEAIEIIIKFDTILNQLGRFMQNVIAIGIFNLSKFL
jgi:hypothetical protein